MANQTYKIARVTDVQIGEALTKLAKEFGAFDIGVQVMQRGLGNIGFPQQSLELWQQVLRLNGELIDHFGGSIAGVSIYYYRGGNTSDPTQKSPALDDLVIDIQAVDENRILVAARILAHFKPVSLPSAVNASDPLVAQRAIQESTFARLQHQLEELFAQTIEVRRKLDESVQEKTAELEANYNAKQQDAEAEIAAQKAELARHADALKLRAEELDDSDNTFARRKIRDGMLSDVTARVKDFDVSETTRKARGPVLAGMYYLILMFVALMLFTVYELSLVRDQWNSAAAILDLKSQATSSPATSASASNNSPVMEIAARHMQDASTERIVLWIRLSLLTVGLIGSLLFYIRWQSRWAEQFANTEQSLKQFHLDVNRANWVVETCLEWRKETDSLIPTPLIESLTRGLFAGDVPTTQTLHPADELASALMGSASKVSLAVGDSKLEFDKPSKIPKVVSAAKPA